MEDKRKKVDISEHRLRKLIMLHEEVNVFGEQGGFTPYELYTMSMDMAPELAREVLKLRYDLGFVEYKLSMESLEREEIRELKKVILWLTQELATQNKVLWEDVPDCPTEQFEKDYWLAQAYKAVRNEKLENE